MLRQLPPSQPVPCYSEITTCAKSPTSYEIPTREMPMVPLNRKNHLKSMGYFRNLPHILDKRVSKPWFPTAIPSAHPFVHRGRENPRRNPTPCSVRHPAGASSPTTSSTATPRRPSSTVPDEDPSSISSSRRFSHPVLHLQGAAPMFPSSFAPPPFPHRRLHLHHRRASSSPFPRMKLRPNRRHQRGCTLIAAFSS